MECDFNIGGNKDEEQRHIWGTLYNGRTNSLEKIPVTKRSGEDNENEYWQD